jgi:Family of unknown function (DUF6518)
MPLQPIDLKDASPPKRNRVVPRIEPFRHLRTCKRCRLERQKLPRITVTTLLRTLRPLSSYPEIKQSAADRGPSPHVAGQINRVAGPLIVGIVIGVATSFGQGALHMPWAALVNAISPWLLGAFVAGIPQRRRWSGALAGGGACLIEVVSYYAATALRGNAVASSEIALWIGCAVIGGPVFGYAAMSWWHGRDPRKRLVGAVLPASFMAEAISVYTLRLHYGSSTILFASLALVALILVLTRTRRPLDMLAAFVVCTGLGCIVYGPVLESFARTAFGS